MKKDNPEISAAKEQNEYLKLFWLISRMESRDVEEEIVWEEVFNGKRVRLRPSGKTATTIQFTGA